MKFLIRTAAALAAVFALAYGTAYACSCEALCTKIASPTTIGPLYPATINYQVQFGCVDPYPGACGCLNPQTFTDSLLDQVTTDPFKAYGDVWCFPRTGDLVTYSLAVTWEQCKLWGTPNGDGSYTLTNTFGASGPWSPAVAPCEASVLCIPPPTTDNGCTATLGYWKNHAAGSRYNAVWEDVGGPGAQFFGSGQTWLQVLSNPTETMKYYILARQYIAATLNQFSGASTPANVAAALTFAENFFTSYGPTDLIPSAVEAELVAKASLLDSYNNGLIGPPHCD